MIALAGRIWSPLRGYRRDQSERSPASHDAAHDPRSPAERCSPLSSAFSHGLLGLEVWVLRQGQGQRVRVTDAEFTFVAIDDDGKPRPLPGVITAQPAQHESY